MTEFQNMTDLERALLHIKTRADAWALKEVEKALSQEPCEDAISRQAVLDEIDDTNRRGGFGCKLSYTRCKGHIEQLPPVTQKSETVTEFADRCRECGARYGKLLKQKTGHWIIIDDCEKFIAKCSECGRIEDSRMISKYPYCHCGAKMFEPQERDIEKRKPCINYEDGCEEWAGCPCIRYKAEVEPQERSDKE